MQKSANVAQNFMISNPFLQNLINRDNLKKDKNFKNNESNKFNLFKYFDDLLSNFQIEDLEKCFYDLHDILLFIKSHPKLIYKITETELIKIRQLVFTDDPIQAFSFEIISLIIYYDKEKISFFNEQSFLKIVIEKLPSIPAIHLIKSMIINENIKYQLFINGFPRLLLKLFFSIYFLPDELSELLSLLGNFINNMELQNDEWNDILEILNNTFMKNKTNKINSVIEFLKRIKNPFVHENVVNGDIFNSFIVNYDFNDFNYSKMLFLQYFYQIISNDTKISEFLFSKDIIEFLTNILKENNESFNEKNIAINIVIKFCSNAMSFINIIFESVFYQWIIISFKEGSFIQRRLSCKFLSFMSTFSSDKVFDELYQLDILSDCIELIDSDENDLTINILTIIINIYENSCNSSHKIHEYMLNFLNDESVFSKLHQLTYSNDEICKIAERTLLICYNNKE